MASTVQAGECYWAFAFLPRPTLRAAGRLTTAGGSRSRDVQAFCKQHQNHPHGSGRAKPSAITEETRESALAFKRTAPSARSVHRCGGQRTGSGREGSLSDVTVATPRSRSGVTEGSDAALNLQALRTPSRAGMTSNKDPLAATPHSIRFSNTCSLACGGGDLARPGSGPADRGAAGAVRGAARRRPGHRRRGGRQRRAICPRGRHQGLEPDAAGAATMAGAVRAAARRLPRPSTASGRRWVGTARPGVALPMRYYCSE
jgi:hypothetical protein